MNGRACRYCAIAMLSMLVHAMPPALHAQTPTCPAGTDAFTEYRLFFGRSKAGEEVVTDEAWRARSWPKRSHRGFPTG